MRSDCKTSHRIVDHARQVEGNFLDRQLAGLDFGKIENVVENAQQGCRRASHHAKVVTLHRVQVGSQCKVGHANNAVHRRADFMAHVGEEFTLRAAGVLRRLLGEFQLRGLPFRAVLQLRGEHEILFAPLHIAHQQE